MERPAITALADLLRRHIDPSKSRLETMALLTVGMIGARTVNLVHVADERGLSGARSSDGPITARTRASTASVLALVPQACAKRRACSGFTVTNGRTPAKPRSRAAW